MIQKTSKSPYGIIQCSFVGKLDAKSVHHSNVLLHRRRRVNVFQPLKTRVLYLKSDEHVADYVFGLLFIHGNLGQKSDQPKTLEGFRC